MSGETASIFTVGKNISAGGSPCPACKKPFVDGQRVYMLCHLGTPWLAEDSEDHEWAGYTWHVECDQGSLAANGAGRA
jgi:hypothetical protein